MKDIIQIKTKIDLLSERRLVLKSYLLSKFDEEDWHSVEDAGSDLRDLDSEIKSLEWILGEKE